MGRKVKEINDSGTELTLLWSDLVQEEYKTGERIELVPAIGKLHKADLAKVLVALWSEIKEKSPRSFITAAVVAGVNCEALVTSCVCRRFFDLEKEDHVQTS